MWKGFCALFKKDCRMLASGKFFLMAIGFLALYTAYVNLGYIRFMQMPPYNVYLYDPVGTQTEVSSLVHTVPSMEAMDEALLADTNGVGLDASAEGVRVVLYAGAEHVDRHRADYALSLLRPSANSTPEIIGTNTPEQKARKEITCELLFFELAAVGFLGIAAVLFKEKGMGVIRVHAILPLRRDLFLLSKLAVFLLSDLAFAVLLTLLNVGLSDGAMLLPAVLIQTTILSLVMALAGLLCALLLKDFRQFTLAYLIIAIFAAKVNNHKGDNLTMLEQYDPLLTISDLREILNIGRNAVYDLLNQGAIPAFRIGRNWKIPKEAVVFYLNQWKSTQQKM